MRSKNVDFSVKNIEKFYEMIYYLYIKIRDRRRNAVMAKTKASVFVCNNCGYESAKWLREVSGLWGVEQFF